MPATRPECAGSQEAGGSARLRAPCAHQRVGGRHGRCAGRAVAAAEGGLQRGRRREDGREETQALDVRHGAHRRRACTAQWGVSESGASADTSGCLRKAGLMTSSSRGMPCWVRSCC